MRPSALADRGEVDDDGDVPVSAAGVPPHVLIDPDHGDGLEPAGVLDQDTLALGQDSVVGGLPRDCQALGDAGDAQVLTHDPFQRPAQAPTRELRPRRRGLAGVLALHVPAPGAPVTADRDQQRRETPAQRLVRQATRDGVARRSLPAAPAAPLIRLSDPAGQDRAVALEALPDNLKAKPIQPGECGQVRANEGNVRHVEVFPIGSVRTPLIGRPRPLPSNRHAHHHYTLDCEEPESQQRRPQSASFPFRR